MNDCCLKSLLKLSFTYSISQRSLELYLLLKYLYMTKTLKLDLYMARLLKQYLTG